MSMVQSWLRAGRSTCACCPLGWHQSCSFASRITAMRPASAFVHEKFDVQTERLASSCARNSHLCACHLAARNPAAPFEARRASHAHPEGHAVQTFGLTGSGFPGRLKYFLLSAALPISKYQPFVLRDLEITQRCLQLKACTNGLRNSEDSPKTTNRTISRVDWPKSTSGLLGSPLNGCT